MSGTKLRLVYRSAKMREFRMGLVSASEAVGASILPRRILYIHTASASEVE